MLDITDLPPQIVPAVNAFAQRLSSHIRAHRDASLEVHEHGVLEAWRAFKRLRRHLARELGRLADLGERTGESAARALDTSDLDASLARLRVALARFALLREAIDEATGTFGRFAAVYPRK